jgi:hypothetical protein
MRRVGISLLEQVWGLPIQQKLAVVGLVCDGGLMRIFVISSYSSSSEEEESTVMILILEVN